MGLRRQELEGPSRRWGWGCRGAPFPGPRPCSLKAGQRGPLGRESMSTQRTFEARVLLGRRLNSGCAEKDSWTSSQGQGPTETRTRITGFRVQSAHHYTMEPPTGLYLAAAEPGRAQPRRPRPRLPPGALLTPQPPARFRLDARRLRTRLPAASGQVCTRGR